MQRLGLLSIAFFFAAATGGLTWLATTAIMGNELYLYNPEEQPHPDAPVHELLQSDGDRPSFLFKEGSSSPGPRVIEFYAPWCPHCQHYAPRFIELARKVTAREPSVEFHAISCVAHPGLCKSQNVSSYPTLRIFREGSYEKIDAKANKLDADVILNSLGFTDRHFDENRQVTVDKKTIARVVPFKSHDVHDVWTDAALSFRFALKTGIFMTNGPLGDEEANAFKEWLLLLSKTLPDQMNRTHDLIDSVLKNYDRATLGQSNLDKIVKEVGHLEPVYRWRTCTYGDNNMGYTCGLWSLFHIMSVGLVEYNRHNTRSPIPTLQASDTLRNYIEHFFQCEVCRLNFLSMYDTCALDGCQRLSSKPSQNEADWRELPLWLLETHNDVNARLMNERLQNSKEKEKPPNAWEVQQSQWPALNACPNCWRTDNSWDEQIMFDHLHATYYGGAPVYIRIEAEYTNQKRALSRWKLSGLVLLCSAVLLRIANSSSRRQNKRRRW